MARRSSGLRSAVKVVKTINRINKQAIREAQKREKVRLRAEAQSQREHDRKIREAEREHKRHERKLETLQKQEFKDALAAANDEYLERCEERAELRKQFIQQVLR